MSKKESLKFKPKARLLLQLGDQLIRNEAIAIFELVKNCYDAYANNVALTFYNINNFGGKIIIEDDGEGMDIDIITNVWMQPGTDYKEKILNKYKNLNNQPFRLPIGEKGIGRFGAYKLGNTIELISKNKKSAQEVFLKIDWPELTKKNYLDDIEIEIIERKPELFINRTGTQITISNLRTNWTKGAFRETIRLINTLRLLTSKIKNASLKHD